MLRTRTARRFAVPAAIATGAVAVAGGVGIVMANADDLPDKTADQVLSDLQNSDVDGFSGTVTQTADLGLPNSGTGSGAASLSSGEHKLGVMYSGEQNQAKVSQQGDVKETSYIRDADKLYKWNSQSGESFEYTLSGDAATNPIMPVGAWWPGATAEKAADSAKNAELSLGDEVNIAGYDAYTLIMTPTEDSALADKVEIAVEAETGMPIGTKVFAEDGTEPVFSVTYDELNMETPAPENFEFKAPEGSKVEDKGEFGISGSDPSLLGSGFTSIGTMEATEEEIKEFFVEEGVSGDAVQAWIDEAKQVDGGKVLESTLVNAYLTDDGRLYVGSVTPDALIEAASH
ncbi:MAG: LolA family protein [Stackebrandtia sp.]